MNFLLRLLLIISTFFIPRHAGAQVWERIMDIPETSITALEVIDGTIYCASGNKLYTSPDGFTWAETLFSNQNDIWVTCFIKHNGKIYAGTSKGIFSVNSGNVHQQWSHDLQTENVNSFTIHDNVLYASLKVFGVLRFNGSGWTPFNAGIPNYAMSVTEILSTPAGLLAIAGANGAFYRHDFGTGVWTEDYYSSDGLMPGIDMDDIISTGNVLYVSRHNAIYRSDDMGANWVQDKQGMLAGQTRFMYATAGSLYNVTMIGTNMGGFNKRAVNAPGTDWSSVTAIAPALPYAIREVNGVLFVATARGLYVPEGTMVVDDRTVATLAIYPNPSAGYFTIHSQGVVESLTAYDVLGRVVTSYDDKNGIEGFTIEKAGFYIIEMKSGGRKVTQKVIVK